MVSRRSDIAFGLFLALLICLAYILRTAVLLIYVSIIFAVVFSPAVDWIHRLKIWKWSPSQGASILILLTIALATLTIFLVLAVPPIIDDTRRLTSDLPTTLDHFANRLKGLPFGARLASKLNWNSLAQTLNSLISHTFNVFRGITGGLMRVATIGLLTAYFILDGSRAFNWSMSMVPLTERSRMRTTLIRSKERVQKWLIGQLLLMLILGSLSAIVFGLLGIKYFYLLAVFAGLANFVPILGPIATVIVAGFVAALDSFTKLLGVIIFFAVYQQVENAYLTPRIMRSTVNLPGVAVVTALMIGGELAGVLGAIVAVPTAALLATVLGEYLQKDAPATDLSEQA